MLDVPLACVACHGHFCRTLLSYPRWAASFPHRRARPSPVPQPATAAHCPPPRARAPVGLPSLIALALTAVHVDGSHPALCRFNTNLTRLALHPAPERRISTCRMCALHPAPWWMYYIQLLRLYIQLPGGCITSTRSRGCIRADVKSMLSLC